MDDFVISNLHESRNEWCGRLVTLLTPVLMEGIRSIYNESWKMCEESNEKSKYLMTFQNLLARIPKWNSVILEEECKRIVEKSGCNYLEDLISCVHIIQLKVLTCIRVGKKQKKIDISIPKLDHFIHRVYIHIARKVYCNIYLFEKGLSDLTVQKYNRELEIITQECILTAIRESIPTESIIRAYLDESIEDEEEVIIESVPEEESNNNIETKTEEVVEPIKIPVEDLPESLSISNLDNEKAVTRLTFNDIDNASDGTSIDAPKTIERLEEISDRGNMQRKSDETEEDDDEPNGRLDDVFDLDKTSSDSDFVVLDGVEDL